uniref:Transcription factor E2F5-like n=1 Tax=Erpetoichthys calabaricus TaxID=27687 RepID=A0A8C4T6K1_ERPCA
IRTSICSEMLSDTLLTILAPSGTQLEVPVPEMGQNGQKKYQVNLRSQSGPIQVLLINKESGSSKPVVFAVPPPDDLMVIPTPPSTPATPQKSPPLQHHPDQNDPTVPLAVTEDFKSGPVVADLIEELMSSDVFPLLRLSPPPGVDYSFNLDDNEGICDLFDVQILNY